jgi:hypothetical protein
MGMARTSIDAVGCVQPARGHLARHAAGSIACQRCSKRRRCHRQVGCDAPSPHLSGMQYAGRIIEYLRSQTEDSAASARSRFSSRCWLASSGSVQPARALADHAPAAH